MALGVNQLNEDQLMNTLLVTYDLIDEEDARPPIVDEIKGLALDWAKLSESSYAILTTETPSNVYEQLKGLLDEDDQMYIVTISKPISGQGRREVTKWLTENL